jgi:succinyl-diaminopimelate desuccinylase
MFNEKYDLQIRNWIDNNRQKMIDMWLDLIRIPSVKSEPAPGAPYGIACAQALSKATEYANELGFTTRLEAERGYSLAFMGEGEKTIGIFGHSDVVPAGDGWIYTEPFNPIIKDGVVIGRGCGDNKSGVMAALFAPTILKECGIPVKSRIMAFVGSNEESGMGDLESYVEHEAMPSLSLVPDASYPCSLGEKGHLKQWNRCCTPLVDIIDFRGDGAFNIVLDYAKVTLRYSEVRMNEIAEKISGNNAYTLSKTDEGHILLTAKGASKHSAYPEGSVNAAVLACRVLSDCATLCESDRKQLQTFLDFMGEYYGVGLGIDFEEYGFGKLTCSNGMVKVEDGHLFVSVDIRYGAGMPADKLERLLDAAWSNAGWELTSRENHHGAQVDPDSPVPEMLSQVASQVTGIEMKPYWMMAGTYSRHLKNTFTIGSRVTDINSTAVVPEMPAGHGAAHQRDEFCIVDDFIQGVRLLCHYILTCDEALNP